MKALQYILVTLVVLCGIYFSAFFVLGWAAPHNQIINRFYSSAFYSLRCHGESGYLNNLIKHEGTLKFIDSRDSGMAVIYKVGQTGIGFKVPDRLLDETRAIPAGTEVIVYIGRKLDRESIGIYQYELRSIKTKEGMEIGSFQ